MADYQTIETIARGSDRFNDLLILTGDSTVSLLERYGLAAGSGGQQPSATVWCGAAGEDGGGAAVYLGADCAARQEVRYAAEGLGPRPVPEQLLAALFAAGRWEPSEFHVVSVTSRA